MPDPLSAGRRPATAPLPMVTAARSLAPVVVLVLGMLLPGVSALAADEAAADGYVGSARCGTCHAAELTAWRGSHHDLAMAEATPENVLGDFDDAEFTAHGVTTRFYRDGDEFRVDTDGPDGKPASYPIAYTFGWTPLQQYLIRFPGGRLQALGIAWDSRPADQGGQRWFHLYPDEADYGPDNPLHWTNRDQTWNYQCAECHSTGLQQGLRPEHRRLHHHLGRDRRRLRGLPRPRRRARSAGRGCGGGQCRCLGRPQRPGAGPRRPRQRHLAAGPGDRPAAPRAGPRQSCRGQHLRPLPRPPRTAPRPLHAGRAAGGHPSAGLAGGGPVLRRRADPRRGLRARLLHPEPHVPPGRHLQRLPRPALAATARARQRRLCPLPCTARI